MNTPAPLPQVRALQARSRDRRMAADTHIVSVITIEFALVVATQKFAIPLGGREEQIATAFLIHFAVLAYLAARGLVLVSASRLILLSIFTGIVAASQIQFLSRGLSLPSMILMLSTSAMLVFVIPLREATYHRLLNRFVLLTLIVAVLVGLDWGFQLVGLGMPDLEALIPRQLVYYEYVYIQPLQWNSPWMKPNGLFFLETSHVSQFIGMGLVIEIAFYRRFSIMLILAAALLSTFGVTGMLLVASSVPFLLARARQALIVAVVVFVPVGWFAAHQSGMLNSLLQRSEEFSQNSSSGYNRFVLPLEWSLAAIKASPDKSLLGSGAGSMPKALNDLEAGTAGLAWPPYTKVGVEYGTIALVIWLLFIATSLFGQGIPVVVSWIAFVQYGFLNGSLNVPIHTVYCALLCAGYIIIDRRAIRLGQAHWMSLLPKSIPR